MMLWSGVAAAQSVPLPNAGNVALPLDEYNHLVELAGKPAQKPDVTEAPNVRDAGTHDWKYHLWAVLMLQAWLREAHSPAGA